MRALAAILGAGIVSLVPTRLRAQVAIVVGPETSVAALSLDDVRRIFAGKVTAFEDGTPVSVSFEAPVESQAFKSLYSMSPDAVKKRWATAIFQGAGISMPHSLESGAEIAKFLGAKKGAIAFVAVKDITGGMKVVKVDGMTPSDAAYPIK
jgi:hypothetical protein